MRTMLTVFPVKRVSIPTARRKSAGSAEGYGKMLAKLNAASDRLARARRR